MWMEAIIEEQGLLNAEVTGDNNVDAKDALKVLKFIAKLISEEELAPQK